MKAERLDKFLTDCGRGTRSQVRDIIKARRVCVDGAVITDGGYKFDPAESAVTVDGDTVCKRGRTVLMMNKPAGYVTATSDASEKTVMELLPPQYQNRNLKPVGRLDKQTEGLLLFTDDGDLIHRLISPAKRVKKIYIAQHADTATQQDVQAFARGLTLGDGTQCLPALLEPMGQGQSRITVYQGMYHQVRRMMASRDMPVAYLCRLSEGELSLGELEKGAVRELTEAEILLLEK